MSKLSTTKQKLLNSLGGHPFFKDLDRAYLNALCDCALPVNFKSGETIFRQGDPSSKFYAILRGKVIVQTNTSGRGALTLEMLGDGTMLGWSWFFPPYKKQFDAIAIGDTETIAIDGTGIREKCEADPKFGYELLKRFTAVIGERLQATRRRLADPHGER